MRLARAASWLDDKVWWHRLRRHKVDGPILQVAPNFSCMANVCHTCDYTWIR